MFTGFRISGLEFSRFFGSRVFRGSRHSGFGFILRVAIGFRVFRV